MWASVQCSDFLVFEVDFLNLKFNLSFQQNFFLVKTRLKYMFLVFFKLILCLLKNYRESQSYNVLDTDADPGTLLHLVALCNNL